MEPLLTLDNIKYSYHTPGGETKALDHISFRVKRGEFISLIGPSGCGKSTILSLLSGELKPDSGQIIQNTNSPLQIGYMLQHDHLFEWRTIYKNILLGTEFHKVSLANAKALAEEYMRKYKLWDFRNAYPEELSGGMRQRASLIRTLMLNPTLLLLDEPFSALDYQNRLCVSGDIVRIIREEKKTAVLVTHDLSEAITLSDRILILSERPAHVKKEMLIDFTKEERDNPLYLLGTEKYVFYFQELWKELYEKNESF